MCGPFPGGNEVSLCLSCPACHRGAAAQFSSLAASGSACC